MIWYVQGSPAGFSAYQFGVSTDQPAPGDYDGDGRTDAAILRRGAVNQVWYVLRSSDTNLTAVTFGLTETDFPTQNDCDGDGKADFSVWRETDGNFYVLRTSDSGLSVVPWGWLSDSPIAGYDAH